VSRFGALSRTLLLAVFAVLATLLFFLLLLTLGVLG